MDNRPESILAFLTERGPLVRRRDLSPQPIVGVGDSDIDEPSHLFTERRQLLTRQYGLRIERRPPSFARSRSSVSWSEVHIGSSPSAFPSGIEGYFLTMSSSPTASSEVALKALADRSSRSARAVRFCSRVASTYSRVLRARFRVTPKVRRAAAAWILAAIADAISGRTVPLLRHCHHQT